MGPVGDGWMTSDLSVIRDAVDASGVSQEVFRFTPGGFTHFHGLFAPRGSGLAEIC